MAFSLLTGGKPCITVEKVACIESVSVGSIFRFLAARKLGEGNKAKNASNARKIYEKACYAGYC